MRYARLCCPAIIRREAYIFTPVNSGHLPRLYSLVTVQVFQFSLLEYLDYVVLIGISKIARDDQRLLDDFHRRHTGVIQ